MKRKLLPLLLMLATGVASAQTAPEAAPAALQWLLLWILQTPLCFNLLGFGVVDDTRAGFFTAVCPAQQKRAQHHDVFHRHWCDYHRVGGGGALLCFW